MSQIVNLTPHTIKVVNSDNQVIREYPSQGLARVSTTSEVIGEIDGIPLVHTKFGEIVGLPETDGKSVFIVSTPLAMACKDRDDLVSPDTGPTAYRVDGQVAGVRNFARPS